MKCSKCGNGIEEGFAFCAGCSASLENADNTVPIEDVPVNVIGEYFCCTRKE